MPDTTRLNKLKEFLALDPNDAFTLYAIGLEYAKLGERDEAIKALEDLRMAQPNYVPTYYQLAGFYREAGVTDKALETYRTGITIARKENDLHAASELQQALDELEDEL
jgi:tetratricopeptide (TPR) repeat protein